MVLCQRSPLRVAVHPEIRGLDLPGRRRIAETRAAASLHDPGSPPSASDSALPAHRERSAASPDHSQQFLLHAPHAPACEGAVATLRGSLLPFYGSSLHVSLLQIKGLPFTVCASPDLAKYAFCLRLFAARLAFVLRNIRNEDHIRADSLHREIAERVAK